MSVVTYVEAARALGLTPSSSNTYDIIEKWKEMEKERRKTTNDSNGNPR